MNKRTITLIAGLAVFAGLPTRVGADAPSGRYVVSTNTVYDNKTKLTWQRTPSSSSECPYTYPQAKDYCSTIGATLGGTGWRLPTVKELLTLIDWSKTNQGFDSAFPVQVNCYHWSSTLQSTSPEQHWTMSPSGATMPYGNGTAATGAVLCVR